MKFPGESGGLILPPSKWNVSEVGTMAYGYGLNATVLQIADAYAMLANKGVKVPLSLYKLDQPPKGEQIIDAKIADQVDDGNSDIARRNYVPLFRAIVAW